MSIINNKGIDISNLVPRRQTVIYITGPRRASTGYEVVQNIRRAEALALKLWKAGFTVICSHKNTALMDGACDSYVWLEGGLELLRRCDAVVVLPDWESSSDSCWEVAEARDCGIPVFKNYKELYEIVMVNQKRKERGGRRA
jgi:hypothetical protein